MAGWEVERESRTACRPAAIARGDSALMPSPTQGAERRPERRAGRTGSRWVLRALVVGGLAGAAWLLTGSAAHAADPDSEPSGSLLGSALHSVATVSGDDDAAVGGLLKAAVQPLESASKSHRRHAVTSILTAPERVLSGPVGTLDEVVHDGTAIDAGPVGKVLRTVIAPPRTSGGTADDRTRTEPAENAADPVTEPEPAEITPDESPADVTPATGGTNARKGAERARVTVSPETLAAAGNSTQVSRTTAAVKRIRHAETTPGSHVQRHIPALRPVTPETIREEPPGDGPEPVRMNLGAVSGIPAGASGSSPEVGSAAVLPARVANGAVDFQLRRPAPEVEVRRHDAEAPTVSPD
ncbi:hypothetical protein AB0M02_30185 [Actinoplanes sp. NPDC051861]|uniref:hypothetical protein n=1 Tax=Actinoplanes sp. NPDC051861 TaxID=3155170 RepID=UPI003433ECB1